MTGLQEHYRIGGWQPEALGTTTGHEIDPSDVVRGLPDCLGKQQSELRVFIYDGSHSVTYGMQAFLSKSYKIRDGLVWFGSVPIKLESLRIIIGYEIRVYAPEQLPCPSLG
jgi:hypothetical protein